MENETIQQEIDSLNNYINDLDNNLNKIVYNNLEKVNKFLNSPHLGDEMRELLEQIKFVYENNPNEWKEQRKIQIQGKISKLQESLQ